MALGAAGVQVGTAYLLCPEVTIEPVHRAALEFDPPSSTQIVIMVTTAFQSDAARHTAVPTCSPVAPRAGS